MEDTIREEYASIKAGTHFWCRTHLSAIPIAEQSPDPRYCKDCYKFLLNEVQLLTVDGRFTYQPWMPQDNAAATSPDAQLAWDKNPHPVRRRGRPRTSDLPISDIRMMASDGLTNRDIAAEMEKRGHYVSYKTIQRILHRNE